MKDLYLKGINYKEFRHNATIMDTGDIHAIEDSMDFSQDVIRRVQKIEGHIHILAFAESWCIDCKINLPVLKKMISYNKKIGLSIVPKEGNEKYMENYREEGKTKIPTFVFLDKDFKEVAHWIEAPKKVKELRKNKDPQHDYYLHGQMLDESIEELILVLEKVESSR